MKEIAEASASGATSMLTNLDVAHVQLCPAIGFSQIVGGRYKLHILCILNRGPHRFGEIGRSLLHGGLGRPITPRILSRELKDLEQRGLVSRHEYPVVPRKVEYTLTNDGRAFVPILAEIIRWGATGAHERILGVRPAATEAVMAIP